MSKFEIFIETYPTIYESCYEIVANSEAAKSVFFNKSSEYNEEDVANILYEIFKYNCLLCISPESMLIHSFFRDCCKTAQANMDIILNGHSIQN